MKRLPTIFCALFLAGQLAGATLFRNGEPQAEILIPQDANPVEKYAARELAEHLRLTGGKPVPVVTVPGGRPTLIRLGRAARLEIRDVPENAALIRISDRAVDIAGKDDPADPMNFRTRVGTLFGVYDFLERELGVRWLWPGTDGTLIRRRADLELKPKQWTSFTPLDSSGWRLRRGRSGWSDPAHADRMYRDSRVWLRRHRCNSRVDLAYGHAYIDFFDRYHATKPELFNLLPDGRRVSDPTYFNGQPRLVAMCVSNPELVRLTVDAWRKRGVHTIVNVNENDTAGKCVCPACLALDGNPDPGRVKRAADRFAKFDQFWYEELGSLTERYAAFYLAVQREAEKTAPNCRLIGCIYANYYEPPVRHKLNSRIIMRFCPPLMYPWTREKVAEFRRLWQGWADSGVSLMLRPNFTWDGHNMPLMYYREFAECFDFARDHGLRFADFDSLTGMFGANGLTLYVIAAKLGESRDKALAELENDYFAAFGPAEKPMREYVKLLADATSCGAFSAEKRLEGGNFAEFFLTADQIFPPELLDKCFALLEQAEQLAADDPTLRRRVAFVKTGLADAAMTLETQRAFREYRKTGRPGNFVMQWRKLERFRADHESLGYADMGVVYSLEARRWPRHLLMLGDSMLELARWQVRLDPENAGTAEKWFRDASEQNWHPVPVDAHLEKSAVFREFMRRTGRSRVVGWYRHRFTFAADPNRPVKLTFGAIDGDADVYLNGELIHQRRYPHLGDPDSWKKPFEIDLAGKLRAGENLLTVRVEKRAQFPGGSGIWRQVFISCGEVATPPLPADGWRLDVRQGRFRAAHSAYPLKLECLAAAVPPDGPYRGVWGRLIRTEKTEPGRTYEFRVRFRQRGAARLSVWLRGGRERALGRANLNLDAPGSDGGEQELIGRIVAEKSECLIYLNLLRGVGEITVESVRFRPVSSLLFSREKK